MNEHNRRLAARRAMASRLINKMNSQNETFTDESVRDLLASARLVVDTWLEWGPTDDGSQEGTAFDDALTTLMRILYRLNFRGKR